MHKIVLHPARPERLFLQNHWGLYRSDDGAESWQDIAKRRSVGLRLCDGHPPARSHCVYILPVESDEFRCTPDERLRVYRTRNAGASWEPPTRGLPQKGAYETVLRDAMTADTLDSPGIYFGTRSGQVYGSRDEGKTWKRLVAGLPSIVCVKVAVVGAPATAQRKRSRPVRSASSRVSRSAQRITDRRTRKGR